MLIVIGFMLHCESCLTQNETAPLSLSLPPTLPSPAFSFPLSLFLKTYMKKIIEDLKESNPDQVAEFKDGAQKEVKKILDTFGDWDFFTGESNTEDAMVALMNYREDGITPYMLFWKDGLVEEKVVCDYTHNSIYIFSWVLACTCSQALAQTSVRRASYI